MPTRPAPAAERGTTRRYRSPHRSAQADLTRRAVLEAADSLFRTSGWSGTSMRAIAARAGVAVETVYATAGGKRALLRQVTDVAVVGDDEPVPLADRAEFTALGTGGRDQRLAAAAHLLTGLNARTAALNRALEHASATDPELARELTDSRTRQRATLRGGLTLVLGRPPDDDLVDGIWAVGHGEVYLLLVESAGWDHEHYERWLAEMFARQLSHLPERTSP